MAKKSTPKKTGKTKKWIVGQNTATCETASEEYCSCKCRGRYHGQPHPANWKDEFPAFTEAEKKTNKREALNKWRRAHKPYVGAYMKSWRVAKAQRIAREMKEASSRDDDSELLQDDLEEESTEDTEE